MTDSNGSINGNGPAPAPVRYANGHHPASRANLRPAWQPGVVSGDPGHERARINTIRRLARGYAPEAVETLASIMRDPDQPGRTRVAAAVGLLDRGGVGPHTPEAESGANAGGLVQLLQQLAAMNRGIAAQKPVIEGSFSPAADAIGASVEGFGKG